MKRFAVVALMVGSLGVSGCALLLVGAGVAGGYAISKDSVRNTFDLPRSRVYASSLTVAKEMRNVTLEDHIHGFIQADIQDARVTVTVKQLTRQAVELNVRARNLVVPKLDVAQQVYSKIVEGL